MTGPTIGSKRLVEQAEAQVRTVTVDEAMSAQARGALLVDLRDVREIQRHGRIPGSYHAPRGMLEFWIDPQSPYHDEALSSAGELILYCNLGWRSALAAKALQDMGVESVAHMSGGIDAWRDQGGPIEQRDA